MSKKDKIIELFRSFNKDIIVSRYSEGNNEHFCATLRLKTKDLDGDSYATKCDNWVAKFEEKTNTGYLKKKTRPNPKRFIYKKSYSCQHSSLWKSDKNTNVRKRDKKCNDTVIHIKVKKETKDTLKKDKYLREGYDVEVQVRLIF